MFRPITPPTRRYASVAWAVSTCVAGIFAGARPLLGQQTRSLGIDVSDWQGPGIDWATVHEPASQGGGGRDFVFIRASRGGTTGTYNEHTGAGTLSYRYDDLYFAQNITNATAAGMLAGTYHFARPDIVTDWPTPGQIPNNGTDEANHFLQQAGAWIKPGYLLPVLDLEAGKPDPNGTPGRSSTELSDFAMDFVNRIHAVTGIYPFTYCSSNYANYIDDRLPQVSNLWMARWPNQGDPSSIDVQNTDPPLPGQNVYGVWNPIYPDVPDPTPWKFWQYASSGTVPGIGGGTARVDWDVAHGGIEFVKDYLVPAMWTTNSSGNWSTISNWNSNNPGYVAGDINTGPAPRLPGSAGAGINDTVILDRPGASVTVTFGPGTTANIRKLFAREALNITGGSLTVNYVPSWDSTPISAEFAAPVTLSGSAAFSVHTLQVDAGNTFALNGGSVTLNTINLARGATPAKISIGGDVTLSPLNDAAGSINPTGSGNIPSVDLTGAARTLTVDDGAPEVDLAVNVPIVNGTLTKNGLGTMLLGGANSLSGVTTINDGILIVTANNQLGSSVVTNETVVTPGQSGHGGSLQLSGNVSYGLSMTIGGGGVSGVVFGAPGSVGALDNLSEDNNWSGPITLAGTGANGGDPLLNQIGARAGTLTLSGQISDAPGVTATWAKSGDGDVVLTGPSGNTYTGLTRLSGGRLIIEKDGALGSAGSTSAATGNTFQLAGSSSTLAFRAPAASGGFNYSTFEVLNTSGNGAAGFAQVDNLDGDNVFAGAIAFSGPIINGIINGSIGVTSGSLEVQGGLYARGNDAGVRNLTKTGPGTLILSADGSGAPTANPNVVPLDGSTFNINGGEIDLRGNSTSTNLLPGVTTWNVNSGATLRQSAGTLGGTVAGVTVNVNPGGSFVYAGGSTALSAVNINGGNSTLTSGGDKALRTAALSITSGGWLDLSDNALVVTAAGKTGTWNGTAYTGVTGLVQSGRTVGAGIVSSEINGPTDNLHALAVARVGDFKGIADGATVTFGGQTVHGSDTVVMYTYGGDANLDGKINIDDYGRIDGNVGLSGTVFGWYNGDFNYDGKINIDDYGIIDGNIGIQGAPFPTAAQFINGVTAVPEPASFSVLAISVGLWLGRGRSRRSLAV